MQTRYWLPVTTTRLSHEQVQLLDAADTIDSLLRRTAMLWVGFTLIVIGVFQIHNPDETHVAISGIFSIATAAVFLTVLIWKRGPYWLLAVTVGVTAVASAFFTVPSDGGAVFPITYMWLLSAAYAAAILYRHHAPLFMVLLSCAGFASMVTVAALNGDFGDLWVAIGLISLFTFAVGMGATATFQSLREYGFQQDILREAVHNVEMEKATEEGRSQALSGFAKITHDTLLNTYSAIRVGVPTSAIPILMQQIRHDLRRLDDYETETTHASLRKTLDMPEVSTQPPSSDLSVIQQLSPHVVRRLVTWICPVYLLESAILLYMNFSYLLLFAVILATIIFIALTKQLPQRTLNMWIVAASIAMPFVAVLPLASAPLCGTIGPPYLGTQVAFLISLAAIVRSTSMFFTALPFGIYIIIIAVFTWDRNVSSPECGNTEVGNQLMNLGLGIILVMCLSFLTRAFPTAMSLQRQKYFTQERIALIRERNRSNLIQTSMILAPARKFLEKILDGSVDSQSVETKKIAADEENFLRAFIGIDPNERTLYPSLINFIRTARERGVRTKISSQPASPNMPKTRLSELPALDSFFDIIVHSVSPGSTIWVNITHSPHAIVTIVYDTVTIEVPADLAPYVTVTDVETQHMAEITVATSKNSPTGAKATPQS